MNQRCTGIESINLCRKKMNDINRYKECHMAFWNLEKVDRPLIGFTIGAGLDSWSYWQYNNAAQALLNREIILPEEINPNDFIDDQLKYLELSNQVDDDIIRSALPLASVPWMEAILGCNVYSTESHMTCKKIVDEIDLSKLNHCSDDNQWVQKYFEFIKIYTDAFSDKYPVAQSIVRGPSDLACAIMGAEDAAMALLTEPERMNNLFAFITDQLEKFLNMNIIHLPKFHDGFVIGQYEIWAPEPAIRIQEDFSNLFSPELYDEFLKQHDQKLAAITNYTLIHLHSSSLFLIEKFLQVSSIRAFQITKDPGIAQLSEMMPSLKKIQDTGKPMILKGQFDKNDLQLMKSNLSLNGLCIQPVVKNLNEANLLLPELKSW